MLFKTMLNVIIKDTISTISVAYAIYTVHFISIWLSLAILLLYIYARYALWEEREATIKWAVQTGMLRKPAWFVHDYKNKGLGVTHTNVKSGKIKWNIQLLKKRTK